jgi:phage baseplate assembly protein W
VPTEEYTIVRLLPETALEGQRIAEQTSVIATLLEKSPVDLAPVLGPTVLLSSAVVSAFQQTLAWIMRTPEFSTYALDLQRNVGEQATYWAMLRAALGNIIFHRRLPTLEALVTSTPGAEMVGANYHGVAIASSLERLLATPSMAGISIPLFWNMPQPALVSVGRLAGIDFVLSTVIDFDPFTEVLVVLRSCVPGVPDAEMMLAVIEQKRVHTYSDRIISALIPVAITQGATLSQIANNLLGDPEQWKILAEYNNLREPFISDDPLAQLGEAQGNRLLAAPTVIGGKTATLTGALGLYQDQRIRFESGLASQILTITGIVDDTVTFAQAFTTAFSTDSLLIVYNPLYDVVGRVVKTGDTIMVPVPGNVSGTLLLQRTGALDKAALFGTDLLVDRLQNLTLTNGDLSQLSGFDNLKQALSHRFATDQGDLMYHPNYGTALRRFLGHKHTPFFAFLASVETRQTVLRDPRVEEATQVNSAIDGDTLLVQANILTTSKESFPSVQIRMPFA